MAFRRRVPIVAPEKKSYVVQADGWVQNTWRKKGEALKLSDEAARYLVLHGVVKSKDDHEATEAAKEAALAVSATEVAAEHETATSEHAGATEPHA